MLPPTIPASLPDMLEAEDWRIDITVSLLGIAKGEGGWQNVFSIFFFSSNLYYFCPAISRMFEAGGVNCTSDTNVVLYLFVLVKMEETL